MAKKEDAKESSEPELKSFLDFKSQMSQIEGEKAWFSIQNSNIFTQ
jgi:hypothetical protein